MAKKRTVVLRKKGKINKLKELETGGVRKAAYVTSRNKKNQARKGARSEG